MKRSFLAIIASFCFASSPYVAEAAGAERPSETVIEESPSSGRAPQEGWDYRMGVGARTKPYGISAYTNGGYNFKIWGDTANYFYGYVRPSAKLATSGVLSTAQAELALYPISFLGLKAHAGRTERTSSRVKSVDCGSLECEGSLNFSGYSAEVTVGYGPYFMWTSLVRRITRPEHLRFDFYDDNESIIGARGGDEASVVSIIAGMKVESLDDASVALYYRRADFDVARAFNRLSALVYVRNWNEWRISTYLGAYRSSLQSEVAQIGVSLEWVGRSGLGLD